MEVYTKCGEMKMKMSMFVGMNERVRSDYNGNNLQGICGPDMSAIRCQTSENCELNITECDDSSRLVRYLIKKGAHVDPAIKWKSTHTDMSESIKSKDASELS